MCKTRYSTQQNTKENDKKTRNETKIFAHLQFNGKVVYFALRSVLRILESSTMNPYNNNKINEQ